MASTKESVSPGRLVMSSIQSRVPGGGILPSRISDLDSLAPVSVVTLTW
ncbi:hypothetical protein EDD27_7967 [Nonomuraea polychroma]|uniref:Uncharacterized protein n=1 Tax=Nonomuraea polychroma TaxID=46176 RepID=A0A438MI91_9ACTN|nr:hypothetical protein EDD27_7967 [Nonomuraea polychroma]